MSKAGSIVTNDAKYYLQQGNSLFSSNKRGAIDAYNKAISLDPSLAEPHLWKGAALDALGEQQEAIGCYDQAIKLNPNDTNAHYKKGAALCALDRNEEAIPCFDQIIERGKATYLVYFYKGLALFNLNDYSAAIKCNDKALTMNPDETYSKFLMNNNGLAYLSMGQMAEAIEYCNKALEIDPKFVPAISKIGRVLHEQKKFQEAIEKFSLALQYNQEYLEALCSRAKSYVAIGDNNLALNDIKKAKLLIDQGKRGTLGSALFNYTKSVVNDLIKLENVTIETEKVVQTLDPQNDTAKK